MGVYMCKISCIRKILIHRSMILCICRLYVKLLFNHDRRDRRQREYTMQNSDELGKLKGILHATVTENLKNMVMATRLEVSLLVPCAAETNSP